MGQEKERCRLKVPVLGQEKERRRLKAAVLEQGTEMFRQILSAVNIKDEGGEQIWGM